MKVKLDLKPIYRIALWASILGLLSFVFDFGFLHDDFTHQVLNAIYLFAIGSSVISICSRYFSNKERFKKQSFLFDLVFLLGSIFIFYFFIFKPHISSTYGWITHPVWLKVAVVYSFIRSFSELRFTYKREQLNPAQLFVISFLLIIFLGALLLMLPQSTYQGISFLDALFTATSAVCVTGLVVVETGTYFSIYGQIIILFLIQIGGLGILTFASYFAYFFKGGTSYENQLVLSDLTNSNKVGEVFSVLKYIIVITFSIEFISFLLIYSSIDANIFQNSSEALFFALFHAISAFCNAGFSTLPNNLFETDFRFNYFLQIIIISTFVFGGLGFPIVSNVFRYLKYRLKNLVWFGKKKSSYKPWVLSLNSRITLVTTFSITIIASMLFLGLEYHNTLAEYSFFGKIVNAIFGATTPRTAGFNTIDTHSLLFPTTLIVIVLMWIGASPSSTGGGIKTSTFAIALLNIISIAKGKTRIEIFRREIAELSTKRAFAIIFLSLSVIGFAIMLVSIFDPKKELISIIFECFSAYSTTGLSLGITADLSDISKLIIIALMFVGRVSMLSILIALFTKAKHKNYKYPTEEIIIT